LKLHKRLHTHGTPLNPQVDLNDDPRVSQSSARRLLDPVDVLAAVRRLIGLAVDVVPTGVQAGAPLPDTARTGMVETAQIGAFHRPVGRRDPGKPIEWNGATPFDSS